VSGFWGRGSGKSSLHHRVTLDDPATAWSWWLAIGARKDPLGSFPLFRPRNHIPSMIVLDIAGVRISSSALDYYGLISRPSHNSRRASACVCNPFCAICHTIIVIVVPTFDFCTVGGIREMEILKACSNPMQNIVRLLRIGISQHHVEPEQRAKGSNWLLWIEVDYCFNSFPNTQLLWA